MNCIGLNPTSLPYSEPSVITVGSFDGVHLGHQELLRQVCEFAREKNFKSVVVTFDPHPQEVLQNRADFFLINSFEQKNVLFEKLGIDMVFVIPFTKQLSQTTAFDFFENYIFSKINVKAILIGPNHHFGKQREGDAHTLSSLCKERGIELVTTQEFIMDKCKVRSTLIRSFLERKDFKNAEMLMGHDLYLNL